MEAVSRYQIADYLNVGTSEAAEWALMGVGFNTLDENPNAQTDGKTYINQKTQTSQIKGYNTQFPFDSDVIKDEAAVMALYKVGRDHFVGGEAEKDYIRVDLFEGTKGEGGYPARKFRVAVEVTSFSGAGGEIVKVSGNLNAVGDFVEGTFNTTTKTFTPAE